ncbi:unnamed protein product [Cyclocybe aegerita]|uniref:CHAT domain-containing protein n=1 Tax=Cyclocybe aegerita TaxID=1973307 RepID=A0A8S0XRL1_CYCAE|nr:unnamed protein product [Cyclocybe aegerita]
MVLVSGRDEPLHIRLKSFTYEQADQLSRDLRSFLQQKSVRLEVDSEEDIDRAGRRAMPIEENTLYRVLRTLWFSVVKPIFDILEYSCPPADRPRIWWCPTGPLVFIPIHAAGVYGSEEDPGFSVSDFVISSYTPTVSVLLDKLQEASEEKPTHSSVLLVSQPAMPGCRPIPGVQAETEALNAMIGKRGIKPRVLENEAGTIDRVKKEMGAHGWVHFACHGVQNIGEPLSSGFRLHDGLLQLRDIMPLRLANTEHAFLSACQTSTGDEKLSDEAVHLAAGMLAAGYRGVVATMWSIQDQYGPEIASDFYSHLLESGKFTAGEGRDRQLDGSGAARALDFSTQKMRGKLGDEERALLAWLPYVHFGA